MDRGLGDFAADFPYYNGAPDCVEWFMAHQLMVMPDRVRKRAALALSEYFVISANQMLGWSHFFVAHYWDQLNEHTFGNFRQLLEAVTLNPLMGFFLNTLGNSKEDPATGRVPDENYAREVMQLFTLGLVQLELDGTPKRDGSGNTIPTFTQDDVTNLARVFTGYTLLWPGDPRGLFTIPNGEQRAYPENSRHPMVFEPWNHSTLPKAFLGTTIPGATPGPTALGLALDRLFQHPNVGPFFARQMIQRLVTSNPSPAYVARVAAKFNDNGFGVRGDLKAVWKAILLDDEATSATGLTSTTFGKVREPMIRTYQWARTFKLTSTRGTWKWRSDPLPDRNYNQRALFSPSVFNFFRPGYVPPGTAMAATGATAPEFQIINESSVSQWANFIEVYAPTGFYTRAPERQDIVLVDSSTDGFDLIPDYSAEVALLSDLPALLRRLNLLLCAGQLSDETQQKILDILSLTAVNLGSMTPQQKTSRVAAVVTLVMCSVEYLVQK